MSTANFYKENARAYYVLDCRHYYNEDGEEIEEWEDGCTVYDDTDEEIDYIREHATRGGKVGYYGRWIVPEKDWRLAYGDSYRELFSKHSYIPLSPDCGLDLTIEIYYRPGYYEAGVLDWNVYVEDSEQRYFKAEIGDGDALDAMAEAWAYVSDREYTWNPGIVKMQARNITRKVQEAIEAAQQEADDFCKSWCTGVYGLAYRCSNGEAGYCKLS